MKKDFAYKDLIGCPVTLNSSTRPWHIKRITITEHSNQDTQSTTVRYSTQVARPFRRAPHRLRLKSIFFVPEEISGEVINDTITCLYLDREKTIAVYIKTAEPAMELCA